MDSIVLDKEDIEVARLLMLRSGLKLELNGLRLTSRAPTCYSIIKQEFGLKGNKIKVLRQFEEILEKGGLL